jgi:DEAD/DEAH box helicase domain-containing protein
VSRTPNEGFTEAATWLEGLQSDPRLADQIVHIATRPAREPTFATPKTAFHPILKVRLEKLGIDRLYLHQALAFDAAMAGENLVVSTGTNSGKSLCYNLPALQRILEEPRARALYLFPTKALARDQAARLEALAPPAIRIGVYDGDTPPSERAAIRRLAHIIITNPDMLHVGILPGHENWGDFLKSLRVVVLDELHAYRGVFGSHVAGILRRLWRLAAWRNNQPQVIACSATIGNPETLFESLVGATATAIERDGSPSGQRTLVFWNPPLLGEAGDANQERASANFVTGQLLGTLAGLGARSLAFSRARVTAELVLRYARQAIEATGAPAGALDSYRAGYTPKERRELEKAILSGKLLGLSATNALELGIDIGGLDAVLINGYPGTRASFWQQVGRSGRGSRDGLAVFVAHDDPLEQFLIRSPGNLLDVAPEPIILNPGNTQILSQQLRCAAYERPISPTELDAFGPTALEVAESLDRAGELRFEAGRFFYPRHEAPAPGISIRSAGGETIKLLLNGQEIGTMERWRALGQAHTGAVYLHRGSSYLVRSLDLGARVALLDNVQPDYYTQSLVQALVQEQVRVRQTDGEPSVALGGFKVTESVVGFRRKSLVGDTVLGVEPLDLPPTSFDTVGVRFDFPEIPGLAFELDPDAVAGLHGAEHALLAIAPWLAGCDRGDLGSAWYGVAGDTLRPAIIVFDRVPGGIGLAERLFETKVTWVDTALALLTDCDCLNGCPRCLLSPRCELANEHLSKAGAEELLRALLQALQT